MEQCYPVAYKENGVVKAAGTWLGTSYQSLDYWTSLCSSNFKILLSGNNYTLVYFARDKVDVIPNLIQAFSRAWAIFAFCRHLSEPCSMSLAISLEFPPRVERPPCQQELEMAMFFALHGAIS